MHNTLTGETVELLQQLIRNQCVNDGTVGSGQEVRTTDVLRAYLEGSGLDIEVYEPPAAPGRTSLVARIEGSDPAVPTLCLMGHTDVVPVNPQAWTRDPFGAELVHGEVWGRGALDMLNLTASQAVALKALARRPGGWRPRGSLVYLYPGAQLLPRLLVGFTDAPYFRARGAVAYGFGLFSRALTAETMAGRFHGNDERIDVESLALTTQAWIEVCDLFLG